jgi:tetratricopeptide (TPR) repeat protein
VAAARAFAELSAAAVEEAAETGRRAAAALLAGQSGPFEQVLDADSIGEAFLGPDVWRDLSNRQRERIRSIVRRRFVETLDAPGTSSAEVSWSHARPEGEGASLFLGLRYPAGTLKTRWLLAPWRDGWAVRDVILSDPGVSLAAQAGTSLGRNTVRRRDRVKEARAAALPRLLGLAAIVAIVAFVRPRLPGSGRTVLYLTAAAPAILFAVDGSLAVRRALSEGYEIPEVLTPPPWQAAESEAIRAERDGRLEDARRAWTSAIVAGAQSGPAEYRIGLALKAAGRPGEAKAAFLRALSRSPAAPGAAKELGLLALAQGEPAEARDQLRRYLDATGPDPDTLSALAVAEASLGESGKAVESVEGARALLPDRWKALGLQAQVYARAGDAAKTVETLRELEREGPLDREILRSDPVYLPIATEPVWVAFLAERSGR